MKTPKPMTFQQVRWACRRGMLELDLFLGPYVQDCYPSLSLSEQACYQALLAESDQDLFQWLMQKDTPPTSYQALVDKIIAYRRHISREA